MLRSAEKHKRNTRKPQRTVRQKHSMIKKISRKLNMIFNKFPTVGKAKFKLGNFALRLISNGKTFLFTFLSLIKIISLQAFLRSEVAITIVNVIETSLMKFEHGFLEKKVEICFQLLFPCCVQASSGIKRHKNFHLTSLHAIFRISKLTWIKDKNSRMCIIAWQSL